MKKKIIIYVSLIILILCGIFHLSEYIFPRWDGSLDLGNNLYLIDWEKSGKIIVYCSYKRGNTCYGGIPVIPHDNQRDVLVKDAVSDQKWIIVKAEQTQNNKEQFYIINNSFNIEGLNCDQVNCDSIIQRFILQFNNIEDFNKELVRLKINLEFSN